MPVCPAIQTLCLSRLLRRAVVPVWVLHPLHAAAAAALGRAAVVHEVVVQAGVGGGVGVLEVETVAGAGNWARC